MFNMKRIDEIRESLKNEGGVPLPEGYATSSYNPRSSPRQSSSYLARLWDYPLVKRCIGISGIAIGIADLYMSIVSAHMTCYDPDSSGMIENSELYSYLIAGIVNLGEPYMMYLLTQAQNKGEVFGIKGDNKNYLALGILALAVGLYGLDFFIMMDGVGRTQITAVKIFYSLISPFLEEVSIIPSIGIISESLK